MDLAGISDGMYLIGADADDFRHHYGPIKLNSFVIVQRLRKDISEGGTERELSVKQYGLPTGESKLTTDRRELFSRSANKAHRSYINRAIAESPQNAGSSDIKIVGVVLAAVRLFNP
jgi:hypothetical protein